MTKRSALIFASIVALGGVLAACSNDAQVASYNLSQEADNFKIDRRIVFYNGITGEYMLTIEGRCSQDHTDKKLTVTCKTGDGYKKHFLGLSNNVTYFSEQVKPSEVGASHYRVTFKPSVILPSVELR